MTKKEIAVEVLAAKILLVRGRKVMLDKDLAELYGVKTNELNQVVQRNLERFPSGFYVSAYTRRVYELEVTNCDFKLGWRKKASASIHGTRCSYVVRIIE